MPIPSGHINSLPPQDWLASVSQQLFRASNDFLASYTHALDDAELSRAPATAAAALQLSRNDTSRLLAVLAQARHFLAATAAKAQAFVLHHWKSASWTQILCASGGIALSVYIFAPSLITAPKKGMFSVFSSRSKRPGRYTVGLVNLANDCFANSNLQALASLRPLLLYIDEAMLVGMPAENLLDFNYNQRRNTRGSAKSTESTAPAPEYPVDAKGKPYLRLTRALGSMIMELNEPVKSAKTISPWKFLVILEQIYNSRISRNQHDAHELLHLILECLSNEYEAAVKDGILQAGKHNPNSILDSDRDSFTSRSTIPEDVSEADIGTDYLPSQHKGHHGGGAGIDPEMLASFPFEGSTIDRIACSRCGYLPPVQPSNFLVLSLMVPQKRHASLIDLIDKMTAPEYIKDYGCVSCRLKAVSSNPTAYIGKPINGSKAKYTPELIDQISTYASRVDTLPEELEEALPKNITSPISKSTRFSKLPLILSLHLSRSIYSGDNASRNSCKVSCPEFIDLYESNANQRSSVDSAMASREGTPAESEDPLNAAMNSLKAKKKVKYRLVAMIRHNGTHYTGHYECYRRKNLTWWKGCIQRYSKRNETKRSAEQHQQHHHQVPDITVDTSVGSGGSSGGVQQPSPSLSASQPSPVSKAAASTSSTSYVTHSNSSSYNDLKGLDNTGATSAPPTVEDDVLGTAENAIEGGDSPLVESLYSTLVLNNGNSTGGPSVGKYEWWRVSDDSIWECHTKDVLKEESGAYLLFYEQCVES